MAVMKIFIKITAKKDSTEAMVKSLLSRTHVAKPSTYTVQQTDKDTQFFLQYDTKEAAQEVIDKVTGEKVHGAAFDIQLLEVEPQGSEHSSEDETQKSTNKSSITDTTTEGENLPPNISEEAIRSITEILRTKPTRKQVSLNISPKNKKRHKKMKSGSKFMRKTKKHSTSSDSDSSSPLGTNGDDNLIEQVKNILAKDPIASGSTLNNAGKPFDSYSGLPAKPSKMHKERTKKLIKNIQLSSTEDEIQSDSEKIAKILKTIWKSKPKKQKKKKKKRVSSSSSDSDSTTTTTDSLSSSSSEDSPTKVRRKLKKLQKKGKLRSGRDRKGLAVIRNETWPHDGINARLAGKSFPTVDSLTEMAFVAGIINPLLESDDFRKMEKKKMFPKFRQKLKVLNELIHGIIRSQNFPEVKDFYLTTLEEIETGQGSWRDEDYWTTQMVLFRTVLRSTLPTLPAAAQYIQGHGNRRNDPSQSIQPRDCCWQFNNDGCSKDSPHPNNDPTRSPGTVYHYCKICLRKNQKKIHGAKTCKAGLVPQ